MLRPDALDYASKRLIELVCEHRDDPDVDLIGMQREQALQTWALVVLALKA